jgi:hypothetical protein
MRYPSFVGGSDASQSPIANCSRTVNWYVEKLPEGSKSDAALYPTPGFSSFVTASDVGGRALFTVCGRTHGVIGTGFYEIGEAATATKRGTVLQNANPAQISYNGAAGGHLCISSGGAVYYLNLSTNALTTVAGVSAIQVGMLDGYFVAFDPTAGKILLSPLNDTSGVWDPTQYAQRSIAPDPWKAMLTADRLGSRELWMIGEQTGEVWYDAGGFPFPFAPIPGALFRYGTPAPFSVAAVGETAMWLSQTGDGAGIVVAARGYQPVPVSSSALELAIIGYQRTAKITDAEALVYQKGGHTFYCLTFPSVPATWVYDKQTGIWCEAGRWVSAENRYVEWHPRVHTFAFGKHLVGDRRTGTIAHMDDTYGTELDGSEIRRLRRTPGLFFEHRQIPIRRIEVYMETGVGLISGQGSDPLVMWRTSDDGGKTWCNERHIRAGKMGQTQTRVVLTRLGIPRDRVDEMVVSDPVPWRIVDCYVNSDAPTQGKAA